MRSIWPIRQRRGKQAAERIAAQFYADTAPKLNVREAQRALERCAKQHRDLAGA